MHKKNMVVRLVTVVLLSGFIITSFNGKGTVSAEEDNSINFRILSTSDMHGRVTDYNYETLQKDAEVGLNKVATLITEARGQSKAGNSILVDAGDFLYDYSTNYFYDHSREAVQPILLAMQSLNYDFITIGNHEFDYPWSYLSSQLEKSGFMQKTIVSNTVWDSSGEEVFTPSTILTRTLTANNGMQYNVKIGIVGATRTMIASKRGDYYNLIDGQSAYNEIKSESEKLKEQGADIVVAITHGGMGGTAIKADSENIAYALSKIPQIDAIVTGHTHDFFPETDSEYYSLPNINKKTGQVNGKPVVASGSYATGLGVIDLTLSVDVNGKVSVTAGKSAVRLVESKTKATAAITNLYAPYYNQMKASVSKKEYKIAKNVVYTNQFTEVEDSNLVQLLNNAKIEFGVSYIKENLTQYKSVPVIACTRNLMQNKDHYVTLKSNFTETKLSQVVSETSQVTENGYIGLYVITGKQLKEWLEYSASAYAKPGTKLKNVLKYSKDKKVSTLLLQNVIYDKSNIYTFDGVSYQIDIRKAAKYSAKGKLVSSKNKRITKLTYNGKAVTNSQKFILAADASFKSYSFMPKYINNIMADEDRYNSKDIVMDYIKRMAKFSSISVKADNNWKLITAKDYPFVTSGEKGSTSIGKKQNWYKGVVTGSHVRNFYQGIYKAPKQSLNVLLSSGLTLKTNKHVPIVVTATSSTSIKATKWLYGSVKSATDKKWKKAHKVTSKTFNATKNGTYSVLVTDKNKVQKVARIKITNISTNIIEQPTVDLFTNRRREVTGTAQANAKVYVSAAGVTYTGNTDSSGKYTVTVPPQIGFSTITVWASAGAKQSKKVNAWVRHTGANSPLVDQPTNANTYISGKTDKYNNIHILIQGTIYVGRGQTDLYKVSEFYDATRSIVETDLTIDENGYYKMVIPARWAGVNTYVFAVDRLNRSSVSNLQAVVETVPNIPLIYDVTQGDLQIKGRVYNYVANYQDFRVLIKVNDVLVATVPLNSTTGTYKYTMLRTLATGTKISAYVQNVVANTTSLETIAYVK